MKPIAVGDRIRVNLTGGFLDNLEGVVKEGGRETSPGFKWWTVHFESLQESFPLAQCSLINLTPDPAELQPGFYWVRMGTGWEDSGGWTVGEYDLSTSGDWTIIGYLPLSKPDEIGERIERKETP